MMQQYSTIAAISTPLAAGGIGIVRISGSEAVRIASALFTPIGERDLENCKGFSAIYGKLYDAEGFIDEVIATKYTAPKSYTGEDVVEFSCHGGVYILRRALRACYDAGAQAAEPGEFTKRAFLNGKMDLTRAESVMELINAGNKQAHRAAAAASEGAVFSSITAIKGQLVEIAANLAAWADYPEEDLPELESNTLGNSLAKVATALEKLLKDYDKGSLYKNGVPTAIVGKPNVGKSTLMNLLSGSEKSIVTEIAGTTRDVVEDTIALGDMVLLIADTAGIRSTDDMVEAMGVSLAKKRLENSLLALAVFDSSSELSSEDMELLELVANRPCVAVINKSDLTRRLDLEPIKGKVRHVVEVSAADKTGLQNLEKAIEQALELDTLDMSTAIVVSERQRNAIIQAKQAVMEAIWAIDAMFTLDAVNVCVDGAVEKLCELTGENASALIIDDVFSRFCVGK